MQVQYWTRKDMENYWKREEYKIVNEMLAGNLRKIANRIPLGESLDIQILMNMAQKYEELAETTQEDPEDKGLVDYEEYGT